MAKVSLRDSFFGIKVLLLFILGGATINKLDAQTLSVVTTVTPVTSGPQTAGMNLTYLTTVQYIAASVPGALGAITAAVAFDLNGITMGSGGVTVGGFSSPSLDRPIQVGANKWMIPNCQSGTRYTFQYNAVITINNSSAINATNVTTTDIPGLSGKYATQTFITPILKNPSDYTICSGSSLNQFLEADNFFTSYSYSSTPSRPSIKIQPSLNSDMIKDVITNTGSVSESVVYTVTPILTSLIIGTDGSTTGLSNTTFGTPQTFTVMVNPSAPRVTSVAITGNGISYYGDKVRFTPLGGNLSSNYIWYTSANKNQALNSETILGVLTKVNLPLGTHCFYVTVSEPNLCESVPFPVTVTIISKPIHIDNVLTPNGDGVGDTWDVGEIDQFENYVIRVCDRRGRLVYFSSQGDNLHWNGTFRGADLPVGVYYYEINFNNGSKPIGGYVTIIR